MAAGQVVLERDLGYAKRVNLNIIRIWLNYQAYERDPQTYHGRLRSYIYVKAIVEGVKYEPAVIAGIMGSSETGTSGESSGRFPIGRVRPTALCKRVRLR